MPEAVKKWINELKEFWGSLDKSQRTRIYITSGVLAATILISLFWLTRSEMIPIVSSNDTKEINEMRSILSENNIEHSLSDNKTSILVDIRDKNDAELAIALEGYPKGGMTFEDAYSYIKINTTESDKLQIWKEYKKKNIVQKLIMFDNVIEADIELAQPEPSLFNNQLETTAFVRINSKGSLTSDQVQGIVMVVSRSVENLAPENVTVVDNNFNILNSNATNDWNSITGSSDEIRYKRKREIEESVYSLFRTPSDSFDFIHVVANPYLDFDMQRTQELEYLNPQGMDKGAVTQEEIVKEDSQNIRSGGAPGVDSNPGVTTYQLDDNGNSTYSHQEERKTYTYSESRTEVERAPGYMIPEKSTMSVAVWWGQQVVDESKLTQELLDQIMMNVSKATGIPTQNISVTKYKLAPEEEVKVSTLNNVRRLLDDYGLFLLILALMVVVLIVALSGRQYQDEMDLELVSTQGSRFVIPARSDEDIPELEVEERSEIKQQIDKIIQQDPDAVAQLLRNWLSEDWD